MKALVVYLNGRPTTRLQAVGLGRKGILLRPMKSEPVFCLPFDEAKSGDRVRRQAALLSYIRRTRALRFRFARMKEKHPNNLALEIPTVKRLLRGLKSRHFGSKQWRIRAVEFDPAKMVSPPEVFRAPTEVNAIFSLGTQHQKEMAT